MSLSYTTLSRLWDSQVGNSEFPRKTFLRVSKEADDFPKDEWTVFITEISFNKVSWRFVGEASLLHEE